HEFGAPDLYDYHLDGINDEPVGAWSLMGGGSFQGDGQSPTAICSYLQWDFDGDPDNGILGWLNPTDISFNRENIEIGRLGNTETEALYRIYIPGTDSTEYFLIENRYESDDFMYDRDLIGPGGLLIWHVDQEMTTSEYEHPIGFNDGPELMDYYRLWLENFNDPEHAKSLTLPQAAFSREQNRTFLSRYSEPNTGANGAVNGEFIIYNISQSNRVMTFSVNFHPGPVPPEKLAENNYPNPFSKWTKIEFHLPSPELCTLTIFNVAGQRVYKQNMGMLPEGKYEKTWGGSNNAGQKLAMGQYFYRIKLGNSTKHGKMIFLPEK
ncbi:MAG: T9SS type A sorting domain-containing protein, partial [Planctomycetes bacterium]|nr:T9SS type A sorting domain-containing protein [Planctomycetota bacterium]